MNWSKERKIILVEFLLALAILAFVGYLSYRNTNKLLQSNEMERHSYFVLRELGTMFSAIKDVETGTRGYILTGNQNYLDPYLSGVNDVKTQMEHLQNLTSDSPAQQKRLARLQPLIESKLALTKQQIETRRKKGFQEALKITLSGVGKRQMDSIRTIVDDMQKEEYNLLDIRRKQTQESTRVTILTYIFGTLISLFLLIMVFYLLNHEITERKRAQQTLDRFFNLSQDLFCIANFDGYFINLNPSWEKTLGFSIKELLAEPFSNFIHPDDHTETNSTYKEQAKGKDVTAFENRFRRKDGSYRWFLWNAVSLPEQNVIYAVARDITERKDAEETLRLAHDELEIKVRERTADLIMVNRNLKILSESNQALVRATRETHLLNDICNIIIDIGGYNLVWVGYLEMDEQKSIRRIAQAGLDNGYLNTLQVTWEDTEGIRGPSGTAIQTKKPCIINNIQNNADSIPWRGNAVQHGYRSLMALPLIVEDKPFGVLNIYSIEPGVFDQSKIALLSELSQDLAFGIAALRTRDERIKAIELLEQSDERYRKVIAQADAIPYYREYSTRALTFFGETIKNITGYTAEEITLEIWKQIVQESIMLGENEGYSEVDAVQRVRKGIVGVWKADYRIITRKGEIRWLSDTSIQIYDDNKNPIGSLGIMQDITDRKQIEVKLRESDERYRKVIAQADEVPYYKDYQTGILTFYAEGIKEITGYTAEEITVEVWNTMVLEITLRGENIGKPVEEVRQKVRSGEIAEWKADYKIRTKNGEIRWLSDSSIQMLDEEGKSKGALGILQDITERHENEEKIKKINESLEQRVKERTAQLETINKELEAFSYSVSHDLRAPLRTIDGFSLALLEDYKEKLDETAHDYLKRVRNATQHMGMLIDDLLNLSRVTRSEIRLIDLDLSTLARTVMDELKQTQPDRKVEIKIHESLPAHGDPRLMRVVLENLLGNAWKFTGKQTHAIIEFGTRNGKDKVPVYFVKDNGVGFDMTYAGKLFGAFQRFHTMAEFPGTGVGLATVQRIIHRHNGKIWAESELNIGTTFYFTLS